MITSKQRAALRKLANPIDTITQVGKDGITENLIQTLDEALTKRELIKIRVLETAFMAPKDVMAELCEALGAEPVQVIGSKCVLYRQGPDQLIEL